MLAWAERVVVSDTLLPLEFHAAGLPLLSLYVQSHQVSYLATRLSSLLVMPDTRQALLRLPEPLLHQLLSSEAVDVEQVGTHVGVCAVKCVTLYVCIQVDERVAAAAGNA